MASTDYKKLKGAQEVKAMLEHCDKEERQKHKHGNRDINAALTRWNAQGPWTYAEVCDRYDARIAALDAVPGANLRKDRVTCFGLTIPLPAGLAHASGRSQGEWMVKAMSCVFDQYGRENVLQYFAHFDEIHEYTDAETGQERESRGHLHAYVIPEHDGKLNGKWFSSKANMVKLNQAIQDMTQRDYQVDFMDGTKRKSRKSVERLKNESLKKEQEQLEEQVQDTRDELGVLQDAHIRAQEALQDDSNALEVKLAAEYVNAALEAFGAVVKAHAPRVEVPVTVTPGPVAEAVRTKLAQQMIAFDERRHGSASGPHSVEGPEIDTLS